MVSRFVTDGVSNITDLIGFIRPQFGHNFIERKDKKELCTLEVRQ